MPQVAYLTVLDKYNLGAFTLVVVLLVAVSVLQHSGFTDDRAREVDIILFWVFVGLTVILNIFFVIYGYVVRQTQLKQLKMDTRQLYKVYGNPKKEAPIRIQTKDKMTASDKDMTGDPYISFSKAGLESM